MTLSWLKRGILISVVVIGIWALILFYWRVSNRLPTSRDVALYLGLLPLGFLVAIWMTRKVALALSAPTADAPAAGPDAKEITSTAQTDAGERACTLTLSANALRSAHGMDAGTLHDAVVAGKAAPGLDAELTDDSGFPVRTGRIPDWQTDEIIAAFAAWNVSKGLPALVWQDEQNRALSMGADVLNELVTHVLSHSALSGYLQAPESKRLSVKLPMLELIPLLPTWWEMAHRERAAAWLESLVVESGWPVEKIVRSALWTMPYTNPLQVIDRQLLQCHRQTLPCLSLLIACDSFIGEQSIAQWERNGTLLTGNVSNGLIPGEGAVGFLLTDVQQAAMVDVDGAVLLHRTSLGRRDKAVDGGRVSADMLIQLIQDALEASQQNADDIILVAADSDQRSSRVAELAEAASTAFPELDGASQCLRVARVCGVAGAVSSLTALAIAHHACLADAKPVICITNQDGFERGVVVLSPLPPPSLT